MVEFDVTWISKYEFELRTGVRTIEKEGRWVDGRHLLVDMFCHQINIIYWQTIFVFDYLICQTNRKFKK